MTNIQNNKQTRSIKGKYTNLRQIKEIYTIKTQGFEGASSGDGDQK